MNCTEFEWPQILHSTIVEKSQYWLQHQNVIDFRDEYKITVSSLSVVMWLNRAKFFTRPHESPSGVSLKRFYYFNFNQNEPAGQIIPWNLIFYEKKKNKKAKPIAKTEVIGGLTPSLSFQMWNLFESSSPKHWYMSVEQALVWLLASPCWKLTTISLLLFLWFYAPKSSYTPIACGQCIY